MPNLITRHTQNRIEFSLLSLFFPFDICLLGRRNRIFVCACIKSTSTMLKLVTRVLGIVILFLSILKTCSWTGSPIFKSFSVSIIIFFPHILCLYVTCSITISSGLFAYHLDTCKAHQHSLLFHCNLVHTDPCQTNWTEACLPLQVLLLFLLWVL